MKGGYNAAIVDREYRLKKMFENRQRVKCKEKECKDCKFEPICTASEIKGSED